MAKTKISEFSSTPANNTDIDSINIAEGCAPSNINDAIRELMAQLKDFQTGAVGDSFNGPIGSSTASTGAFTNITASGTLGVTGVATLGAGAILNTPASVTLTNATGLPISTGVSGLGTGVATALAVNVGSAGAPVVNGGALGTPSSGTVTNLTGTASININGTVGATTPTTGAFTTLAASSSVTLSGGTANGVTYLNGSKVLTSGSALTFDGSIFQVDTSEVRIKSGTGVPYLELLGRTSDGRSELAFRDNTGATNQSRISNINSQLAFDVAGSEQMRLTSTGLGIGTSSPSQKLEVNTAVVGISTPVRISNSSATTNGRGAGLEFFGASNTFGRIEGFWAGSDEQVRLFSTGSMTFSSGGTTERMRLTSTSLYTASGINVGFGTSSTTGYRLNVVAAFSSGIGGAYIEAGEFNQSALIVNHTNASVAVPLFQVQKSGTGVLTLDSAGNLGLGVTPIGWSGNVLCLQGDSALAFQGANGLITANAYYSGGWKYTTTGAASYYYQIGGAHQWTTAASGTAGNAISFTQAMTLDASGHLLVGTTTSNWGQSGRGIIELNGSSDALIGLRIAGNPAAYFYQDGTNLRVNNLKNGAMAFYTNDTERARIDSSGNFLVYANTKETRGVTIYGTGNNGIYARCTGTVNYWITNDGAGTGSGTIATIYNDTSVAGSITVSGTTTAYVTSSDYRLKENVQPMTGALDKVAQLKPVTYTWKADGASGQGFIAHELQAVAPDCVVGEKDAVDADGNIKPQGIDTSFLVATLTAAIQEQQAIIESLKARLDAANL